MALGPTNPVNLVQYPTQSQAFSGGQTLWSLLRAGTIRQAIPLAGIAAWNLQGFGQSLALGLPGDTEPTPYRDPAPPVEIAGKSDEEICEHVFGADPNVMAPANPGVMAMNPLLAIGIRILLKKLADEFPELLSWIFERQTKSTPDGLVAQAEAARAEVETQRKHKK
jgi:hypothetical protein